MSGLVRCRDCGKHFLSTINNDLCWKCEDLQKCGCYCGCKYRLEIFQKRGDRCGDCQADDHAWGETA